jgi:glucokinase
MIRLGLDIGGTKIAALALNGQQRPLAQVAYPTQAATPQAFQQTLSAALSDLLQQAGITTADVTAVGVGIPGQVNQQTGRIYQAVNLNLDDYPFRAVLQEQFDCPVYLENDVAAAALGAYCYLQQSAPKLAHIAYLGIGTGIAAGLIINGRIHRGARGMAGEIGHVIVEPDGAACKCGARGCLETIVAGPAIARQAAQFLSGATAEELYVAARQLPAAQALVERVSAHLAQAIHWLMMAYDVDKIVLGGGVSHTGAPFLDPILAALARLSAASPLAQTMLAADNVVLLPPTYNPGLWGAAYLAELAD